MQRNCFNKSKEKKKGIKFMFKLNLKFKNNKRGITLIALVITL